MDKSIVWQTIAYVLGVALALAAAVFVSVWLGLMIGAILIMAGVL